MVMVQFTQYFGCLLCIQYNTKWQNISLCIRGISFLKIWNFLQLLFLRTSRDRARMPNWFMHRFKKSKASLCHFLFLLIDCYIFKCWILFFWKKPSHFFDQMLGTIISLLVLVSSVLCLQFAWCQGFLDPKL